MVLQASYWRYVQSSLSKATANAGPSGSGSSRLHLGIFKNGLGYFRLLNDRLCSVSWQPEGRSLLADSLSHLSCSAHGFNFIPSKQRTLELGIERFRAANASLSGGPDAAPPRLICIFAYGAGSLDSRAATRHPTSAFLGHATVSLSACRF